MYAIGNKVINEIVINKSRFIAYLVRVDDVSEVKKEIDFVKRTYKDATHYCYAYIIDDIKKSSDDGEPGGTAGVPIMEVLLKNNLNYALCVVVRYFGGIKLGAGGLVRAYSKAAVEVIKKADLVKIIAGYEIIVFVNYDEQKKLDNMIKGFWYEKEFENKVKYIIRCDSEVLNKIKDSYCIESIIELDMI